MRVHVQDHVDIHTSLHLLQDVQNPILSDVQGSGTLALQIRGLEEAHLPHAAERRIPAVFPLAQKLIMWCNSWLTLPLSLFFSLKSA